MDWNKWSGFDGEGLYAILNRESFTSLSLSDSLSPEHVKLIECVAHIPYKNTQLWIIRKRSGSETWFIECLSGGWLLTADNIDSEESVIGAFDLMPPAEKLNHCPFEALWLLDTGMNSLDPGKLVTIRSVKYPGFVLDIGHGQNGETNPVTIQKESGRTWGMGRQAWLFQKQS